MSGERQSAEKDAARFVVGQRVWQYDANDRTNQGPWPVKVTKVGRKLITVAGRYSGRPETYRIEDGGRNDQYGRQWIKTDQERAAADRRNAAIERLHAHGLRFDHSAQRPATKVIEAICDVLDAPVDPPTPDPSP